MPASLAFARNLVLLALTLLPPAAAAPQKGDVYGRPAAEWAAALTGPELGGVARFGDGFLLRLSAIRALGEAGPKAERYADALLAQLAPELDPSEPERHEYLSHALRSEAAAALAAIGPKVLPGLGRRLTDPSPLGREGVAYALARFGLSAKVVRAELEAALATEREPLVRVWLVAALARSTPEPAEHLEALVAGFEAAVARSAEEPARDVPAPGDAHFALQAHLIAFGELGPAGVPAREALEPYRGKLGSLERLCTAVFIATGPKNEREAALAALVPELLVEWDKLPTQHALRLIGADLVDPITATIGSPATSADARVAGCWMLHWLGLAGIPALGRLAAAPEVEVARASLGVFHAVAGPEHARALALCLAQKHDPDTTRPMLTGAFARTGAEGLAVLEEALGARDPRTVINALRCLPLLAGRTPALEGWKKTSKTVQALERHRDAAVAAEAEVTARALKSSGAWR